MKISKQKLNKLIEESIQQQLNERLSREDKVARKLNRLDKSLRSKDIIISHGKAFDLMNDLDIAVSDNHSAEYSAEELDEIIVMLLNNTLKEVSKYNRILDKLDELRKELGTR